MQKEDIDRIVDRVVGEFMVQNRKSASTKSSDMAIREFSVNERDIVKHVALGSDHRGLEAKNAVKSYLETLGYTVIDIGVFTQKPVDYPDIALSVAKIVATGKSERGIVIDGAGIGSAMACNKVKGIRAALCYDMRTIISSREHNNANILTLGGPMHSSGELCEMVKVWLTTRFAGGRHWARVNKLMAIEREQAYHEPG